MPFKKGEMGERDYSSTLQVNSAGQHYLNIPREISRKLGWNKKKKVIYIIQEFYGREFLAIVPCKEKASSTKSWVEKKLKEEETDEN